MYVVGLTGGIGSGKSTVARHFTALGIEVIDADVIARDVVQPGEPALTAIAEHFGQEILQRDGSLDRAGLRHTVFADPDARHWLEALLHPLIRKRIETAIAGAESAYVLLVSPLLLETSQRSLVDRILVIDLPEAEQLRRTLARDGGDEKTIRAIMASQLSRDERLQAADDVLDNSTDVATLEGRVESLHKHYLELARQS